MAADFVDCEWELLSNLKYSWRFYKNVKTSEIIISFHNFKQPIKNEDNLFSEVDTADLGPDCDVHLWDPEHVRAWLIGNHLGDLSSKL